MLTLPNSAIADAEVRNISSEEDRRVKTVLALPYDTTPAEMDTAIETAVETVNGVAGVDTDRTGAWFWEYGDSALRLRLEYHITALDRWKAVKGTVNRELQRAFTEAGLELAVPTRTVRLEGPTDGEARGATGPAGGD